MNTTKPIRQWLHSCYVNKLPDGSDAVVVSELVHNADGNVVPELTVIKKPKRAFYITKPQYRNHNEKKEIEDLDKLDTHYVYNCELEREIFHVLNGYYPNSYVKLKELCASPYLYGADISIETLIKSKYKDSFTKSGKTISPPSVGFLDIERSVLSGNAAEITVVSLTHENTIYTAILRHSFFTIDAAGNHIPAKLDDLITLSNNILDPMITKVLTSDKGLTQYKTKQFKFEYYLGDTELDLIRWIFARLHENKTSLVGVWNLNYDIPAIIDLLKKAKVPLEDVFCPPELDPKYRKVYYRFDDSVTAHPTDKWHWLHCTSYSQFYDAMSLYSKLRTVVGKESSYKLDDILEKNGLGGKLHFTDLLDMDNLSKIDWHRQMQSRYPLHYIVYNQWDVISLQLMDWKNNDARSMLLLSDYTSLSKYVNQTRKVADTLYVEWIKKNRVLGTTSSNMRSPYDAEIGTVGGAVLSPHRLAYNGLNVLTEAPHHKTQLHAYVSDLDFTAFYPTAAQAGNISKETKLSTVLYITGESVEKHFTPKAAVQAFFSYIITPQSNAVNLGCEFFGLPDFKEMLTRFNTKDTG